jgi:hypothetical protein
MIHISCGSVSTLQWAAAGFAVLAAVFWFFSSLVKFPPLTYAEADKLPPALRRQGRLSAMAALCAAVAAAIQAILIAAPTCINLSELTRLLIPL